MVWDWQVSQEKKERKIPAKRKAPTKTNDHSKYELSQPHWRSPLMLLVYSQANSCQEEVELRWGVRRGAVWCQLKRRRCRGATKRGAWTKLRSGWSREARRIGSRCQNTGKGLSSLSYKPLSFWHSARQDVDDKELVLKKPKQPRRTKNKWIVIFCCLRCLKYPAFVLMYHQCFSVFINEVTIDLERAIIHVVYAGRKNW